MFISHFKSLSGKARHQRLLTHDREGIFTTEIGKRLPQRSPSPLAMPLASVLVTICLLLWMVQNAITTCKSNSLVGGNSKRMTLTPLSSSCVGSDSRRVISHSLTTPNFFSETKNDALSAIESNLFLGIASATLCAIRGRSSCFLCENTKRAAISSKPQVFSRKCAPASSLSSASCSLGVTSTPFSHRTAPWRSSSSPTPSSSFPTPQSTSSPPDTWRPVPNHQFQARKKTPPYGRVFPFSGC